MHQSSPTRHSTPPAATHLVAQALADAQTRHALFPRDPDTLTPVVVGVSGGLDSVCLLHALRQVAAGWKLDLHVAHLDHALRDDSHADAAFVDQLAHDAGLPLHHRRLADAALQDDPDGVEAAARRARYAFLAEVAQQVAPPEQPATIAVAHHQDDQAETVLMHIVTGSGLAGLGGMAWVTTLDAQGRVAANGSLRVVRPLLNVARTDLAVYAAAHDLTWRTDSTNQDPARLRNRLRHEVLPLLSTVNPSIRATLARNAEVWAAEADRAAQIDAAALRSLISEEELPSRMVLDAHAFATLHPATQRGVLRLALARLGADLRAVGSTHIEHILSALERPFAAGGPVPLPGGLVWSLVAGQGAAPPRLSLHRRDALPLAVDQPQLFPGSRIPIPLTGTITPAPGWELASHILSSSDLPADWRTRTQPWTATVDADAAGTLVVTTPQPGMRMAPLGMGGHHRNLGDLFTDRKLHPAFRPGWPVVIREADDTVVWLCGVAVAEPVRVHTSSVRIRRLVWRAHTPTDPTN